MDYLVAVHWSIQSVAHSRPQKPSLQSTFRLSNAMIFNYIIALKVVYLASYVYTLGLAVNYRSLVSLSTNLTYSY